MNFKITKRSQTSPQKNCLLYNSIYIEFYKVLSYLDRKRIHSCLMIGEEENREEVKGGAGFSGHACNPSTMGGRGRQIT